MGPILATVPNQRICSRSAEELFLFIKPTYCVWSAHRFGGLRRHIGGKISQIMLVRIGKSSKLSYLTLLAPKDLVTFT
jgi:hypothetical protein